MEAASSTVQQLGLRLSAKFGMMPSFSNKANNSSRGSHKILQKIKFFKLKGIIFQSSNIYS